MKHYQQFKQELIDRLPSYLEKRGVISNYQQTSLVIYETNDKVFFGGLKTPCGNQLRLFYDIHALHSNYCDIWDNYHEHPFTEVMRQLTDHFVADYQMEYEHAIEQETNIRDAVE